MCVSSSNYIFLSLCGENSSFGNEQNRDSFSTLLSYSLLVKTYKLKNNEISYDNNNFKYTYMSGLEIVTEFIKVKKVGTINKQTHYFLNRLNLVHLKINSIGNNSDINLRYYDKQYHLKLEKDFLEKETVYANNI